LSCQNMMESFTLLYAAGRPLAEGPLQRSIKPIDNKKSLGYSENRPIPAWGE